MTLFIIYIILGLILAVTMLPALTEREPDFDERFSLTNRRIAITVVFFIVWIFWPVWLGRWLSQFIVS